TSRRFSKGYFGFDISGTIPFHRPTKWVQYRLIISTRGLSLSLLCQGSGQKDPEHPPRSLLELPSREIRRCANLRRGAQFVME
ncbi:hypothetical protein ACUNIS_21945, partial [Serratia sp. IR-2025]